MISFREVKESDIDALEKIEKASFKIPWTKKGLFDAATNELTIYLLAADGENTVAYAGAWLIDDEAQITNVAVLPDYRGEGIASSLLNELIKGAVARGAERMTLEVRPSNEAALALYNSFDFKDFGRRPRYYQDNGEDAIIMWNLNLKETLKKRGTL